MTDFLLMLDSTDAPSVFAGLKFDALAGYGDGLYDDVASYRAAYPSLARRHRVMDYAVHVQDDGTAADCELGDMSVAELRDVWLPRQIKRGAWRPVVYANLARWNDEGLRSGLEHYHDEIRRIVAWYTYRPEIDRSILDWADGQQFSDRYAGRNIDGNIVKASFFGKPQPPTPRRDPHYDVFPAGKLPTPWGDLSERGIVERYDGARKSGTVQSSHEVHQYAAQLAWFARRVNCQAVYGDPQGNGKPNWGKDHRGTRFVLLGRRSHGVRVV